MQTIENQTFGEERALYQSSGLTLIGCAFDGEEDGESALKESCCVTVKNCRCNLRYPFWHNDNLTIEDTEMTSLCRAALWYTTNTQIKNSKLHGIKALRECKKVLINDCDIVSPEFGWYCDTVFLNNCTAESEYFMLRSKNLYFRNVKFTGKYSFQYIENSIFENCEFDTKDAFWHAKNVKVKNCVVKGEYLGWYSDGVRFENCKISGTQPLCWCKNLTVEKCEMNDTDLCFEKSDVQADILTHVESIKNPLSGMIYVDSVGEIIKDDPKSKVLIMQKNNPDGLLHLFGI